MTKLQTLSRSLAFENVRPEVAAKLERRRESMLREFERHANRRAKRFERSQACD